MQVVKRHSLRAGAGTIRCMLLGVAISCISQAATVVSLGAGEPLASQLRLAARFYGLDVVELSQSQLADGRTSAALANLDTVAAVASGEALSRLRLSAIRAALRRAGGQSVPLLLVDSGTGSRAIAEWTGGAVSACSTERGPMQVRGLRIERTNLAGPLADTELPFLGSAACRLILPLGSSARPLATTQAEAGAQPLFLNAGLPTQQVFVAAQLEPTDTNANKRPVRRVELFAGIAPLMLFLHAAAGDSAWHAPALYANLTVDDPWLREPYGNLNYNDLAAQMKLHRFHTTIAFIPWNFDRSEPAVAALFRANPERFSIAIHGNNHNHREFDDYTKAPLAVQSASLLQALARMEHFSRDTRIQYDPVMIFPHAVSPAETFARLKELNYWATTNSENVPLDSAEPGDALFALRPETLTFNNFLSIKRVSAEVPVSRPALAVDAFLGNPLLLYVHQEFFSGGAGAFNPLADYINRIAPGAQWRSVGQVVRHLYLQRSRPDGGYDILAFSPSLVLDNATTHSAVFHVTKAENFKPPIRSLLVDGQTYTYQATVDSIAFAVTIAPGQRRSIQFNYGNEPGLAKVDVFKTTSMVGALRLMSDFRDNVLSRSAAGRTLVRLYSQEPGISGSIILLLTALPVLLALRLWRRKKRHVLGPCGTDPAGAAQVIPDDPPIDTGHSSREITTKVR